jgi:hypothetical protein
VVDLFGGGIMLRDMKPRGGVLTAHGEREKALDGSRGSVWAPRKRDAEYARALLDRIERHGSPDGIVYVGDSLLQDGAAIRGLRRLGPPGRVWGFVCCPSNGVQRQDGIVDGVFLGSRWSALSAFVEEAQSEGLRFGRETRVLFDLDHTVYAAKGRDEEPLSEARSIAVCDYLKSKVPAESFEFARAEYLYREFEQDRYHGLTQDNLDYVVALALAVLCGLSDVSAVRKEAREANGIALMLERMLLEASVRAGLEVASEALEEIHLGALAGNPTPCKEVRRYECLATATQMLSGADQVGGIYLNREVVEMLDRVVLAGATVLAVSDRPVEATVAVRGDEEIDLMTIPMAIRGEALPPMPLRRC